MNVNGTKINLLKINNKKVTNLLLKIFRTHARLGEYDVTSSRDSANPQDFIIIEYFDPGFNEDTYANDIAVAKLNKLVNFDCK